MTITKTAIALLAASALTVSLSARDQIKIAGSSTVYPFSSSVAEELGATTKYPTPVVESIGSTGGKKALCEKAQSIDIANASSRMKEKEFKFCQENGVTNITEAVVGYDGISIAQDKSNSMFSISKKELALAVAKEVPSKDGKKLIANPYKKWSDINAELPNREIVIYGPPKSSGTRAAFEEMVMQKTFKKMSVYTDLYKADKKANKKYKKYSEVRTDGLFVESGENDNLIVAKLTKNKNALGVFGFSYLIENADKISGVQINKVSPTAETIATGDYPISRSLYFYINNNKAKEVPAMAEYVKLFMSDKMIGTDGILTEIGLIPLADKARATMQKHVADRVVLKAADLKKH
jgi:phosphate transport system substrate-binding protein